jgi:hypothetical protein
MACFDGLPNELLLEIVEILARGEASDLWGATLTSKTLHELANPLLYRALKIHFRQTCSSIPFRVPLLIRTLFARPDLCVDTKMLSFDCTGVMGSRDLLALIQQKRILAEWRRHLLDLERIVLEGETRKARTHLLEFQETTKSKSEALDTIQTSFADATEDEALRLYGVLDGSISHAISHRRDEVLKAYQTLDMKIHNQYPSFNRSFNKRSQSNEDQPLSEDEDEADEPLRTQQQQQELMSIIRPALDSVWTRVDGASPDDFAEELMLRYLPDIFLSLLPNVEHMSLDLPASISILSTICQGLVFSGGWQETAIFDSLTSITVGYSAGVAIQAEDLSVLFTLPNLKAIDVRGCEDFGMPWQAGKGTSSITSLKLTQADLTLPVLDSIIQSCKRLEVFEYTHRYKTRTNARIPPNKLVQLFEEHVDHLLSFSCDTPGDISGCINESLSEETSVAVFACFKILTRLDVSSGVLTLHHRNDPKSVTPSDTTTSLPQLYASLPRSLKHLTIRHCHEEGTNTISKHVLDLLQRKITFPNLSTVTLTCPSFKMLDVLMMMMMRDQIRSRGIQIICEVCEPSRVSTLLHVKEVHDFNVLTPSRAARIAA